MDIDKTRINKLEDLIDEAQNIKYRIQEIENHFPTDNQRLLDEHQELKSTLETYQDYYAEYEILKREIQEDEIKSLPYETRLQEYEKQKIFLKNAGLTPQQYEKEIKRITELYDI